MSSETNDCAPHTLKKKNALRRKNRIKVKKGRKKEMPFSSTLQIENVKYALTAPV